MSQTQRRFRQVQLLSNGPIDNYKLVDVNTQEELGTLTHRDEHVAFMVARAFGFTSRARSRSERTTQARMHLRASIGSVIETDAF